MPQVLAALTMASLLTLSTVPSTAPEATSLPVVWLPLLLALFVVLLVGVFVELLLSPFPQAANEVVSRVSSSLLMGMGKDISCLTLKGQGYAVVLVLFAQFKGLGRAIAQLHSLLIAIHPLWIKRAHAFF